jgi:hypothetical protein
MIRTSDGGFLLVGHTDSLVGSGIYLVKINSSLAVEWTKVTGDSSWHQDLNSVVEIGSNLGYLGVGSADHYDSINGYKAGTILYRFDMNGDTIWTKFYNNYDPGFGGFSYYLEDLGNYTYAMGTVANYGTGGTDFELCHIDSTGLILDTLCSGLPGAILPVTGGHVVTATDRRGSPGAMVVNGCPSPYTYITDPNYSLRFFAGSSAVCGDGLLTVGYTDYYTQQFGMTEYFMMRINSIGDTSWSRHWSSGGLFGIDQIDAAEYYIHGTDSVGHHHISKVDSSGNYIWTHTLDPALSISQVMVLNQAGDFALYGDSTNSSLGSYDMWLAIFDSSGNDITSIISTVQSIEAANQFQIFPNPSAGEFMVKLGNSSPNGSLRSVKITDVLGKCIFTESSSDSLIRISLPSFTQSGIYVVTVTDNFGSHSERMIIE